MKRRFEFRLERVRAVRDIEEKVARAERAQAEALARAAEASRDEARSVLAESRASLRAILAGELEPMDVLASHRMLDDQLARLRRRTESARTLRIQAERMAAAHRERRSSALALEELRERARQRHDLDLQKEENAALDEVAQRISATAEGAARSERDAGKAESASRTDPRAADQDAGPAGTPGRAP